MEGSILTTTKKLLGIEEDDTNFDTDIIMYVNSAFSRLHQLAVGPSTCFRIKDKEAVWTDFTGDRDDLESVGSYIYLKTRLIFDPPTTSVLIDSIDKQIQELEWELNIQVEGGS
jgi:tryptophanyl-tRNA synthetase